MIFGAPPIVTNGLVLSLDAGNSKSYPGSGTTWSDLSGNRNTGTLTPGASGLTFNRDGGGSLVFDGTDDYINIPASATTAFTGTNYTISVWVKLSSIHSSQYSAIVSRFGPTTNYQGYAIEASNNTGSNKFAFLAGSANTFNRVFSDSTIIFNKWYNLVGTSQSNVLRFYIDSVIQSTTVNQATTTTANVNLKLGRYYDEVAYATQFLLVGSLANTQIYNRALTSSEVQQNYNALKSRFNLS